MQILAGIAAVCGHIWTLFAGFRGGKGINTAAGMLVGIAPIEVSISLIVFLLVLFATGYVSLGSITGSIAFPTSMFVRANVCNVDIQGYHTLIAFSTAVALLLIYTHRTNIKRLLAGTENRFTKLKIFGKKSDK
jgi:glycerol-3-phosphate acyltransferase PlsY